MDRRSFLSAGTMALWVPLSPEWAESADVILDNLYADKILVPMIEVMPNGRATSGVSVNTLEERKVPHVWHADSGGHEWRVWKNDLYLLSQMLFVPQQGKL